MAIWIAKAVVQKSISFLPYRHRINYFFQKYITKGLDLTDTLFESKLHHFKQHADAWNKSGPGAKENLQVLEIGTGWFPVVPVAMFLFGAEKIYSADIESLLNNKRLQITIQKFLEYDASGKLRTYLYPDQAKLKLLREIADPTELLDNILQKINMELVVGDVTKNNSIRPNLIISNNTFEHIPPEQLDLLLAAFKKMIRSNGIMSHFIDMSDHFSHLDNSITPYHYLRFSDAAWKMIDNSIQPQNRLRISDYRALFIKNNWQILEESPERNSNADFSKLKLSGRFRTMDPKDVLITHVHFICKAT